jgi:hypothetical protein
MCIGVQIPGKAKSTEAKDNMYTKRMSQRLSEPRTRWNPNANAAIINCAPKGTNPEANTYRRLNLPDLASIRKQVATMEQRKAMASDTTNALNAKRLASIAVPARAWSSATKPPGTVKAAANVTVAIRADATVLLSLLSLLPFDASSSGNLLSS